MLSDALAKLRRLEHFRIGTVPENPPGDLTNSCNGNFKIERAVIVPFNFLGLVPSDLGHIARHKRLKPNCNVVVGPRFRDEAPSILQIPFDAEAAWNAEGVVEFFHFRHPTQMESAILTMQGRPSDDIPAPPIKEQLIRSQFGRNHFPLGQAVIANSNRAPLGNGIDKTSILAERIVQRAHRCWFNS